MDFRGIGKLLCHDEPGGRTSSRVSRHSCFYRKELATKNLNGEERGQAGPVTLGQRLVSSHFPQGFEDIAYGRGTWLIHMLRQMLRDSERKESTVVPRGARQRARLGEASDELFFS